MIVLDTDSLTYLFRNHPSVLGRIRATTDNIAMTIISRIEILQGRFDTLFKASNGAELLRGQERLDQAVHDLARVPTILRIEPRAATQFDRLRQNKKLRKIGRGDLLIAAVTLANRATLVTRNLRDFRQIPGLSVENWID